MKKLLALLLSVTMIALALTACGSKDEDASETTKKAGSTSGTVKTGLAVITTASKSTDAGASAGLAQTDSTVIAVTVDANGKILNCAIDAAQTKINFDTTGTITTDLATVFSSKVDLGKNYGMSAKSSLGKEWSEEAAAFAKYVVGKTVDQIKGIAVNEEGVATEADLTSSVTISVAGFISGIEKAVTNATAAGAGSSDKLGIGITTTIAKSTNATDSADGLAQAYSTYTAATFDKDGKITSCIIDGSQTNVNFSKAGKITTDLANATYKTKDELGTDYGLKAKSGIGKEWNEQAAAFAKYVIGKTVDQVKGIAVDDNGKATDTELTASVTVSVGGFINVIEKASNHAN